MHNKEAYQARVRGYLAMGRCPRCSGKNRLKEGETVCPECREKSREAGKRVRDKRNAAGVCTRCGRERDGDGKLCARCRERHNAYNSKYDWYHRMREEGRCVKCGKWAVPGMSMCEACREADRDRNRNRNRKAYHKMLRDSRKAAGVCVDCGGSLEGSPVTVQCKKCHARRQEYELTKRARVHLERDIEKARREADEIRRASRAKWERDAAGWRAGAQPGAAGKGYKSVLGVVAGRAGAADAGQ